MEVEAKTCPKCNKPMRMHEYELALPVLISDRKEWEGKKFSDRHSLDVQPSFCPDCRYVELYAT